MLGNTHWELGNLRKPERPSVEWARLDRLSNPHCTIGILRDGTWVVETADGLADLADIRALVFALPLLQSQPSEVRNGIECSLREFELDESLLNKFPFARLIAHAVENGGFWAEQSFDWLYEVELGTSDRHSIIEGLKQIEGNKDYSQKLRHDALKHRIRMERNSSETAG